MAQAPKALAGDISPCPDTPNCVSSQADPSDKEHFITPLEVSSDPQSVIDAAAEVLSQLPRTTLITRTDTYVHGEARSRIFRFVDDVEVSFDTENGLLHFRSAARLGRWDFGVNRRRLEKLIAQLRQRL